MKARRVFIRHFFMATGAYLAGAFNAANPIKYAQRIGIFRKDAPVKATYAFLFTNGEDLQHVFFSDRSQWENSDGIERLTSRFRENGGLLSVSCDRCETSVSWSYVFANNAYLDAWNELTIRGSLFDIGKLDKQYKYVYTAEKLSFA